MMDYIQAISDIVVWDRAWSWSVMGICYVGLSLIIRNFFLRPIVARAKNLKRAWYNDIKDNYNNRSIAGWIFYIFSLLLLIYIWTRPRLFPLDLNQILALAGAVFCYLFSILLHVQAFGTSSIITLKKIESEKV